MSVDLRLMFVYHISMMVMMFITGTGDVPVSTVLMATAFLVLILVSISIHHRREANWRWPGIRARNVIYAVITAALMGFFLFAATPLFPIKRGLLWYLAGLGIGIFSVLNQLQIVYQAEVDFLRDCRTVEQHSQVPAPPPPPQVRTAEVRWKKVVGNAFQVAFLSLWIGGVSFFYVFGTSFKHGSPVPTASNTEPLQNHGVTVFLTPAEKRRLDLLKAFLFAGMPSVLISGLVLHFIAGVKVFNNTPTLGEYLKRKTDL